MSKALMLAAAVIGCGVGYRAYDRDIEDDLHDVTVAAAGYAPVALELVDAARMVVFSEPEDLNRTVFDLFGDDYAEKYSDDDNTLPSKEWCHARLYELVSEAFEPLCVGEQETSLRTALNMVLAAN